MEVTNLLDITTREELYRWYTQNSTTAKDFWVRVNRASTPTKEAIGYIDAVEVALCFGWIDSTQKRIDDGKPVQHFTPRRKRSNWCERNLIRCRNLVESGEMTPAGLAVAPDLDPAKFVYEKWYLEAIKADKEAWANYKSFPENYRRIKADVIQHYFHTDREEYGRKVLNKFIQDCKKGKLQPGWDDNGRIK